MQRIDVAETANFERYSEPLKSNGYYIADIDAMSGNRE